MVGGESGEGPGRRGMQIRRKCVIGLDGVDGVRVGFRVGG